MIHSITFTEEYKKSKIMFFDTINVDALDNNRIVPLFGPNGIGKTTLLSAIASTLNLTNYIKEKERNMDAAPPEENPNINISAMFAKINSKTDIDLKFGKQEKFDELQWYKDETDRDIKKTGCLLTMDDAPYKVVKYFNSENNFRNMNTGFNPFLLNCKYDAKSVSEGQSIVYSIFDLFEIMKPGPDMIKEEDGDIIILIDEMDSGLSIDNIDILMRKIKKLVRNREDVQIFMSFNNPRILKFFPQVISLYDGKPITLHTDEDMLEEMRKHKKMFDKARRKKNGMPKVYD